jgi:hypothetical protein
MSSVQGVLNIHLSQQCSYGYHVWLPWLEINAKGVSDVIEGDIAQHSYITRCTNCGKVERWNV